MNQTIIENEESKKQKEAPFYESKKNPLYPLEV